MGATPLFYGIMQNNRQIVTLLHSHGARVDLNLALEVCIDFTVLLKFCINFRAPLEVYIDFKMPAEE